MSLARRLVPATAYATARAALRGLTIVAWSAVFAGCPKPPGSGPTFLGDTRELDAAGVDPAFREDWAALEQARETDAGSDEVVEIANRLLERDPPLPVRLAALRAKAEHAYESNDDLAAIAVCDEALASVEATAEHPAVVVVDLWRIRASALARGGDPQAALRALADPMLATAGRLSEEQRHGLTAVALDRNADHAAAVAAYARWRAVLDERDPAAAWAEHRLRTMAAALDPEGWTAALAAAPAGPARDCLIALQGGEAEGDRPAWVVACGHPPGPVGILLPRTGKLAALSDVQLAAAVTAAEVLGSSDGARAIVFEDSGSTTASARQGAQRLLHRGSSVVVGPVGASNISAVLDVVGGQAAVIVPGESRGAAVGVAPSLERRVARLTAHAAAAGKTRLVILAPDNTYGKRAVAAAKASERHFSKSMVVQLYPSTTTSFKPVLTPIMTALSGDAALLVADHLPRTEAVVRQVLRSGKVPARGDGTGLFVMTTAEGSDPAVVAAAADVFEGVWASPVAAIDEDARPFADAYAAREGVLPTDQALLVFLALRRALAGPASALQTDAPLVRFVEGSIVGQASSAH
jgi:hypothetical protein